MRVHLVDATYELFRAFFAWPASTGRGGREVGACKGLARSLVGLVRRAEVSHVACAFDHVIESFRNELFAGYKTGAGIEPRLLEQFELAERLCEALGIVTWPMLEFEADDALATAAKRFAAAGAVERVIICSPDKDLMQCVVGHRVVCWDRMRDRVYDEAGVLQKHGVLPESIPDYLALVGDAADGIPGVPRWGRKSASSVLAVYRHLEDVPAEAARWSVQPRGAAALSQKLREHWEDALAYRRLATLRTDVPITETLDDLEYRGARKPLLEAVCAELEDDSLLSAVDTTADDDSATTV